MSLTGTLKKREAEIADLRGKLETAEADLAKTKKELEEQRADFETKLETVTNELAALKKEESWQRDRYIEEKGKWAVMAGDDAPKYDVADACVDKLSELLK